MGVMGPSHFARNILENERLIVMNISRETRRITPNYNVDPVKLRVRPMSESDINEVYRINKSSFTTDAWSRDAIEREFKLPYSVRFVLESDGKVIGYCVIWLIKGEAFIMSIAIDKNLRGRGLGRYFMEKIIDDLRNRAQTFLLDVRKSNLPAIRLYRSLGFSIVKERKKFYSDGENALLMELRIDRIKENEDKGKTAEAFN